MKALKSIIIPLVIIHIVSSKVPTQDGFGLQKRLQGAQDALSSDLLEYVEEHISWSSIFYVNHRELQQTDDDIFEKYNTRCHKESDCGDSIFLHCHRKNGQKICQHKPIFPLHESEILGTVVLTVLMALAVISGIGGGGIIVSLLMVFYKLNTKEAIAVSGFTIFLGSIARFLITINKRHPHKDAPVIDYSLANIMLPTVLVGSLFGVFLNLLLPSLVLQIFLSIVLALLACQSGFKAVHIYQQESMEEKNPEEVEEPKQQQNINQQNLDMEIDQGENENLLGNSQPSTSQNKNNMDLNILPSMGETEETATIKELSESVQLAQDRNIQMVQDIEDNERNHQQWEKHVVTLSIFTAIVLLNIYRGSQSKPSIFGVKSCSVFDWGGIVVYLIFCVFLTYRSIAQQQHEQELKKEFGHGLTHNEISFEGYQLFKLLFFSFSGGLVSGALGMGGGSVFNPLLLSFGVPPQVSSATGSYMIIFSTGASTLTYILNDMMDLSYGIWAGCFCIMGSILGMLLLDMIIKKLDRQSPQVFLLCFILSISAIAVPLLGYHTLNGKKDLLKFHNICYSDSSKI